MELRLLGINDLHGHLEPTGQGDDAVGGVPWLAAGLDRHSEAGHTIRVAAGDTAGGSPLISAHFNNEPAVEALNAMHFDVGTVGNHEFDEGVDEMERLAGIATFPYVGANSVDPRTGESLLPPYTIVERAGVRVGFIGVTTRSGARWLLPRHAARVRFDDLSDTVNRWVPELQARGVETIVVLAHAGGIQETDSAAAGEIAEEVPQMSDAVDVVVAGHTHTRMNLMIGHKLVVQQLCFGMAFSDVRLQVDAATGDVVSAAADIVTTSDAGLSPDPSLARLVDHYRERLGDLATRPIADLPVAITRAPAPGGSALGRFVAEAQRSAAHAQIAFVNRDWLRADLAAGPATYADLFEVQPFGNALVRMTLRGSDIQKLSRSPLLEAAGLPATIDPAARYTVVANEFLAAGGEDHDAFTRGTSEELVGTDIDALVAYVRDRAALRALSR